MSEINEAAAIYRGNESEPDESKEAIIVRLMARMMVPAEAALELIDEIVEAFGHPAPAHAGLEIARRLEEKHRQAWHFLISYQASQTAEIPNLKKNLTVLAGQAWQAAPPAERPRIKEQFQKISDEIDEAVNEAILRVSFSTRVMALELDFTSAAGAASVAEIGRICGLKKQTVNKCALEFQPKLGMAPREGQRDAKARANMAKARISQISPTD